MKKYFGSLLILSLSYFNAFSQTNVYPADGNVGLGITTPTSKLSVRGDIDLTTTNKFGFNLIDKFTYNTMIQPHYGLQWLSDPDYVGGASFWLSSYGGMKFFAGSLPRLVITNVGNIGIGINSPKGKLTVNGDIAITSPLINSDIRPAVGAGSIVGEIRGIRNDGTAGWDDGFLRISAGGGTNANAKSFIDLSGYARLDAVERDRNIIMGTAGLERFRISAEGNIGIGTIVPFAPAYSNRSLHLAASGASQRACLVIEGNYTTNTLVGGLIFLNTSSTNTGFQKRIAQVNAGREGDNNGGYLSFATMPNGSTSDISERMRITNNGYVGIGTSTPKEMLSVNGKIRSQEIKVENTNWPDYVFMPSYNLPSLQETEQHIKEKGHLPGIPSAEEVKNNGVDLGEMNAKLLQKIEELTLHLIRLEKQNEQQQKAIEVLQSQIKK